MDTLGLDLRSRPLTLDDIASVTALQNAANAVDPGGEHVDTDEMGELLDDPNLDREQNTLGVFAGERMVAWAEVLCRPSGSTELRIDADGEVHPEYRRRGLGTRVLQWQRERGNVLHLERRPTAPGLFMVARHHDNESREALYTAAGLPGLRWWFDMERPTTGPVADAPVPAGLTLVPFEPSQDEAVRRVLVETFADHWGSPAPDEQTWERRFVGSPSFRRDLSMLLMDGDEIAGYLLSFGNEAESAATGISKMTAGDIGVRRAWRRRGAAAALLTNAVRQYAAAGFAKAHLAVDADNPTGALGVYQRCGFEVTQRWVTHAEELPPPRP